jgi:four helix bundle protein
MKENKLADLSMSFAVKALEISDRIEGHYSLKNQFERSATSIGANIREANYAHSTADFISKLQIALKESYETEYWLELFTRANLVKDEDAKPLLHSCGELRRMLVASVTTLKNQ